MSPLALLAALGLAGCTPDPVPASPALWEVSGPDGGKAWLFGTVHALERPAAWHTPEIGAALAQADSLVVEVRDIGNGSATAETFARLARSPGLPPLSARVDAPLRPALAALIRQSKMSEADLAGMETWAAAIVLARASAPSLDERNGIDRAVMAAARGMPVIELEGAAAQLGIFDQLPEAEQRDMLTLVVREAQAPQSDDTRLAEAWRTGDFAVIEAETKRGLLADPELRAALFTGRNQAWTQRITGMIRQGRQPFVAVGAAHMAGPEGLPAMLSRQGYAVRRIQ